MGINITTNIECGAIPPGTFISKNDKVSDVIKRMVYSEFDYITFSSDSVFTVRFCDNEGTTHLGTWDGALEYSTDKENWYIWNGSDTITSILDRDSNRYYVYITGKDNSRVSGYKSGSTTTYNSFTISGNNVKCSGNINSLLDGTKTHSSIPVNMNSHCYAYMFSDCTSLTDISQLVLPSTTLADYCYRSMFNGCTSLTDVSQLVLPATTLVDYCYSYMFQGCTSLTTTPVLPATTLAQSCYRSMFNGCTSLTTTPVLPATTLANYCYYNMFASCTSLTDISQLVLPSTTLADYCYQQMFNGCTSLTIAPQLPATTLKQYCYVSMFSGCTSLTTPPQLPATELATSCYSSMFKGCNSLTTAPVLPATTLGQSCYYNMFNGCTSLATTPVLPATTLAGSCYYEMFRDCTSLTTLPAFPVTTVAGSCCWGMFYDCRSIKVSTTKTGIYQYEWRVPKSGTISDAPSNWSDYMFGGTGGTFQSKPDINTTYYTNNQPIG